MEIIKKILFIGIFSLFLSFSVYGKGEMKYDCGHSKSVLNNNNKLNSISKDLNVLKKDGVERAFKNTKAYCCQEDFLKGKNICNGLVDKYAESPFLSDQLIDIGFRKLDGNSKVSYVKVDSKGKKWYKKKKKLATNIKGKSPGVIYNEFMKKWGKPNDYKKSDLYGKYMKTCYEIRKVYDSLGVNYSAEFGYSKDMANGIVCYKVVSNRYNKELDLVTSIMMKQGTEKINKKIKEFSDKKICEKGLSRLIEKFTKFNGFLRVVTNKVQEGTSNCNQ